ncbi:MAG: hypothetical protein BGN92_00500 [Sphingobacteriales bacterium 41-5]|nr:MAG: hypothetical protein BGN92_00500 [Sphingobacteriales bacterium 41-5]
MGNEKIEFQNLETLYGCRNTTYLDIGIEKEEFVVITNQGDFNRIVNSELCRPAIDFKSYNLLIGKKSLSSGNSRIDYELIKSENENLTIRIVFTQNMAQNAPTVVYNVLIPKRFESSNLKVEYQIR